MVVVNFRKPSNNLESPETDNNINGGGLLSRGLMNTKTRNVRIYHENWTIVKIVDTFLWKKFLGNSNLVLFPI